MKIFHPDHHLRFPSGIVRIAKDEKTEDVLPRGGIVFPFMRKEDSAFFGCICSAAACSDGDIAVINSLIFQRIDLDFMTFVRKFFDSFGSNEFYFREEPGQAVRQFFAERHDRRRLFPDEVSPSLIPVRASSSYLLISDLINAVNRQKFIAVPDSLVNAIASYDDKQDFLSSPPVLQAAAIAVTGLVRDSFFKFRKHKTDQQNSDTLSPLEVFFHEKL